MLAPIEVVGFIIGFLGAVVMVGGAVLAVWGEH